MTELKTTASLTDGSGRMIDYKGDPKGTEENVELTVQWDALNNANAKALLDALNNDTVIASIVVDTDVAYGGGWYVGHTPIVVEQVLRDCMVRVTFTKDVQTGRDFPYEDRSITTAYDAIKTPSWTATKKIYHNSKTAPTMAGVTYGSLTYTKNAFGRYDGELTIRTYPANESAPASGYGDLSKVFIKQSGYLSRSRDGTTKNTDYMITTYLTITEELATAVSDAEESSHDPSTNKKLGRIDYNRRYGKYFAYKEILSEQDTYDATPPKDVA